MNKKRNAKISKDLQTKWNYNFKDRRSNSNSMAKMHTNNFKRIKCNIVTFLCAKLAHESIAKRANDLIE